MSVRYEGSMKIIEVEDTTAQLTDVLADLLLIHGGNREAVLALIEDRWDSAERHYEVECQGESEGFEVLVDAQDSPKKTTLVPIKKWAENLPERDN